MIKMSKVRDLEYFQKLYEENRGYTKEDVDNEVNRLLDDLEKNIKYRTGSITIENNSMTKEIVNELELLGFDVGVNDEDYVTYGIKDIITIRI